MSKTLTDIIVKNAKPKEKIFRIFDERGLYLEISPKGGIVSTNLVSNLFHKSNYPSNLSENI
jgi:hypothetical protein